MKNKVLVIDNYDSFTYNLVHYMEDLDFDVTVVRNDEFSMDFVENFDKILISPGPGIPDEAGQTKELIKRFYSKKSIMGVCLGHQAIGEVFGGKLKNLCKTIIVPSSATERIQECHILIGHIICAIVESEYFKE